MLTYFILLFIIMVSLFLALRRKKSFFLIIPFLSLFLYFLVQVFILPASLTETIEFIFNLN